MCYHNSMTKKAKELKNRYKVNIEEIELFQELYHENGFNHLPRPVITSGEPDRFSLYSWGLIPSWSKNIVDAIKISNHCLNAKTETVFETPSFRGSIMTKRCIIPSTGFFEWKEIAKGKKQPYYVRVQGEEIFSMAGIYEHWKDRVGETTYRTYSILTRPANEFMAEIHNTKKRMPIILPRELESTWLNTQLPPEEIKEYFFKNDNSELEAWPVSNLITSRKENSNVPEVNTRV